LLLFCRRGKRVSDDSRLIRSARRTSFQVQKTLIATNKQTAASKYLGQT
jgi:hypothetical protein